MQEKRCSHGNRCGNRAGVPDDPSRIPFMTKRVSAEVRERFEVSVRMIKEKNERCSHEKPLRRAAGCGGSASRPACRSPQHAISIAPLGLFVIKPVVYCAIRRDGVYSCHSQEAPVEPSEGTGLAKRSEGMDDGLGCAQGCARRLWKAAGQRREPLRDLK